MDLQAYPRTISDLFTIEKKYIVPRFQREYSWGEDELIEFWNDIIGTIKSDNGVLVASNYFIGSIVLIGNDTSKEFQIVDGQQRLTTITIALSVLVECFKEKSSDDSQGLYKLIEGKDLSNKQFFKLVSEKPKPYFQNVIQGYNKSSDKPGTSEEKKLEKAYKFFDEKLKQENLSKTFGLKFGEKFSKLDYLKMLNVIRDQIIEFKVISIYVPDQDYAYDIFETLNARGMNLTTIDLVKNEIFKVLNNEHPIDSVKEKWTKITKTLNSREDKVNVDTFFRHYWISKHEFRTESKIFKSFKSMVRSGDLQHAQFLDQLVEESARYIKVSSSSSDDWNPGVQKKIYKSLEAMERFRVAQQKSLTLALLQLHDTGVLTDHKLLEFFKVIEKFHFSFTAVCSSRPSGLESKYSSFAREARKLDKKGIEKLLKDLQDDLREKSPDKEAFLQSFNKLSFTNGNTRYKKLIQYIFCELENSYQTASGLELNQTTLEHIMPQSGGGKYVGNIGNIIPLPAELNTKAGAKDFATKLSIYKSCDLIMVKNFLKDLGSNQDWNDDTIIKRGLELAEKAYNHWKI